MFQRCRIRTDDYYAPDVRPIIKDCQVKRADPVYIEAILTDAQRADLAARKVQVKPITIH